MIINGIGGSGKSTFCDICKSLKSFLKDYRDNEYEIVEKSTIDWPKQVAQYCGWDNNKNEKGRKFLSDLKNALEEWDESPSNKIIDHILTMANYGCKNYIYFVNIREPLKIDEFKTKIKKQLNIDCNTLLIRNSNAPLILSNDADKNVEKYNYDKIIENNYSLDFLAEIAKQYLLELTENN